MVAGVARQSLEATGGDGFAAGLFYGLLAGEPAQMAVNLGWAHGALLTTYPGDTTMATVEQARFTLHDQHIDRRASEIAALDQNRARPAGDQRLTLCSHFRRRCRHLRACERRSLEEIGRHQTGAGQQIACQRGLQSRFGEADALCWNQHRIKNDRVFPLTDGLGDGAGIRGGGDHADLDRVGDEIVKDG